MAPEEPLVLPLVIFERFSIFRSSSHKVRLGRTTEGNVIVIAAVVGETSKFKLMCRFVMTARKKPSLPSATIPLFGVQLKQHDYINR